MQSTSPFVIVLFECRLLNGATHKHTHDLSDVKRSNAPDDCIQLRGKEEEYRFTTRN